jgi:hypothetical protein
MYLSKNENPKAFRSKTFFKTPKSAFASASKIASMSRSGFDMQADSNSNQ